MDRQEKYDRVVSYLVPTIAKHLGHLSEETIDFVAQEIGDNSSQVLAEASKILVRKSKSLPKPAHIIEAVNEAANLFAPRSRKSYQPGEAPWEQREKQRKKLVAEYVQHFELTSATFKQAAKEGWKAPLLEYVKEAANIQAQLINPHPAGYISHADVEVLGDIRPNISETIQRGTIDVAIPAHRIRQWQGE